MKTSNSSLRFTTLIGILIIASSFFAKASTFHVRKDGSDTLCNGSGNFSAASAPNCAFLTVQKGINVAQPADTVSVHAGDYSSAPIVSVRSGLPGSPITISVAVAEMATLGSRIQFSHNYLTLQGFQVTNFPSYPSALFEISGSFIEIRNNYIYSNSAKDFESSVGMHFEGSNNIFEGNTMDGKATGPNINVPSIWIPIVFAGTDHRVARNVFKNLSNTERVFELNSGRNITIVDNEIFNLWQNLTTGKTHVDIFQNWCLPDAVAFVCPEMTNNIVVERNYIHDVQGQISNMGDGGGPFIVRNNIFANITSSWMFNTQNVRMTNNTFYRVGTEMDYAIYSYGANADISGLVLENNIFFATGSSSSFGPYAIDTAGRCRKAPCLLDFNFVADSANRAISSFNGWEAHGVNGGDPKFLAASSNCVTNICNFALASGSIAQDRGITISGYSTDYISNSRTEPWDIGAYEVKTTTNGVTLRAPQNLHFGP